MKVKLKNIQKNPHRNFDLNPIDQNKIEKLKESIERTDFWDNIMARPKGNLFELAYGHHRLEVLKQIFGDNYTIEVIVRNLNDDQMLQIMTNENNDWYSSSANKHEVISAAKKLHPEYNNKEIAELLNINPSYVSHYKAISKAIEGNYFDKSIIKEVENYHNLSVVASQVIKNKTEKKDIKQIYERSMKYVRQALNRSVITKKDFDNAFKDIQNERTFLKIEPKTQEEEERFIELCQLISKAKDSVFDARLQVQTVISLKESINDNKERYRFIGLINEIQGLIKISQPIIKLLSNKININKNNNKLSKPPKKELLTTNK